MSLLRCSNVKLENDLDGDRRWCEDDMFLVRKLCFCHYWLNQSPIKVALTCWEMSAFIVKTEVPFPQWRLFSPGCALLQKKGLLGEWVSHYLWEFQMHNTEQILKCYLLIYLIEMLFTLVLSSPKLLYCLMERWHNKMMTFLCGVMDWLCVGYSRGHGSLPHHMQWVSTKE